jgi:hypothetical protein
VTSVLAHGLGGRADLPIPEWLFGWAAAIVLVISFVSLGALWKRPLLADHGVKPFPAVLSRVLTSRVTDVICGVVGVALFVFLLWAGFAGVQSTVGNIVPTFVYVAFWVGLVFASLLFGDVFRPFNPWRAIGRSVAWAGSRLLGERLGAGLLYPQKLGYWPAAAGLFAFAWLELLASTGTSPRTIAAAALAYSSVTFLGMGIFGVEPWCARGEAFSVYFGLFARMSPVERRGQELMLRPPLTGVASLKPEWNLVAVLSVMIGTVTFDGLQETAFWSRVGPRIADGMRGLGTGPSLGDEVAGGIGMVACVAAIATFFLLGIAGARTAGGGFSERVLAGWFAPSLVPIAFVYVAAHYVTFLLFQGQALFSLVSDPLGRGWDIFGTAGTAIDYGLIGATATWYVQVVVVVCGHCAGLALAHDRALELYAEPRRALRSQYWMLVVMIGFTSLALWLLSQANA